MENWKDYAFATLCLLVALTAFLTPVVMYWRYHNDLREQGVVQINEPYRTVYVKISDIKTQEK